MNLRPPGYEPDELPAALPCDIGGVPCISHAVLHYNITVPGQCQQFFSVFFVQDVRAARHQKITTKRSRQIKYSISFCGFVVREQRRDQKRCIYDHLNSTQPILCDTLTSGTIWCKASAPCSVLFRPDVKSPDGLIQNRYKHIDYD